MILILLLALCPALSLAQNSIMRQMWMTPIQVTSVLNHRLSPSQLIDDEFISKVRSAIIDLYDIFQSSNQNRPEWMEATHSDKFYMFQQELFIKSKQCNNSKDKKEVEASGDLLSSGAACSSNSDHEAIRMMEELIGSVFIKTVKDFLSQSYINPDTVANNNYNNNYNNNNQREPSGSSTDKNIDPFSEDKFFIWTSVHTSGSYHSSHYHKNSMVSGVLYINVPKGAGDIVFHDPRGSLPPFGKSLHLSPQVGDLILFPSWLAHEVLPTTTHTTTTTTTTTTGTSTPSYRISISFNLEGSWDTTADVNIGYRL